MQELAVVADREVRVDRHGVQVPGDHHALVAAQLGARDHGVAGALDVQVRERAQRLLHRAGDGVLAAADGLDVDQLLGQRDGVGGEVQVRALHGPIPPRPGAPGWNRRCRLIAPVG